MAEPSSHLPVLVLELIKDTVAVGLLDSSRELPGNLLSSFPADPVSLNRCFPEYSPIPEGLGTGREDRTRP